MKIITILIIHVVLFISVIQNKSFSREIHSSGSLRNLNSTDVMSVEKHLVKMEEPFSSLDLGAGENLMETNQNHMKDTKQIPFHPWAG